MTIKNNEKIAVHFDGDSYIRYSMHQEMLKEKRRKERQVFMKENQTAIVLATILLISGIVIIFIVESFTRPAPVQTEIDIVKFLAIAVGVGWMIHGVGFSIVGKLS